MLPQKRTQKPQGAPPYPAPRGYVWAYDPDKGSMELESVTPETPEKLSDKEQAVQRIMTQQDPRFPGMAYPGSAAATADTLTAGIPPASKVRAEEQKAKRQTRMDKQSRLKELRAAIRATIILRNKKVVDPATGEGLDEYPPGSEDRAEIDAQIAAMKQERDELEGKPRSGQSAEKLGPPKPGKIAGDGTPTRPYEIQESQEQFDAVTSGAWFRLPGDPPGKARQKP